MTGYIFIILYIFYLVSNFIFDKIIPGFGGDQYGLYNLFQKGEGFENLGLFDQFFKRIVFHISFGNPSEAVFLCFIIPFLINSICGILAIKNLQFYKKDYKLKNFYFELFLIFEPLSIALLLSGHVFFLTNLSLLIALKINKLNFLIHILFTLLFLLLNPYLVFGFILFVFIFSNNNRTLKFYFYFILICVLMKLIVEINYPKSIASYLGLNVPGRLTASGLFPFNFFLPDINSILGSSLISLKNSYYTYLNVPESNYSLLLPIFLIILFVKFDKWHEFFIIILVLIFFLPPTTRYLEGVVFPSYVFNFIFPELRILSRNFSFIYILIIIYIYKYSKSLHNFSSVLILSLCSILLLPIKIPFVNFNDINALRKCDNYEYKNSIDVNKKPWDEYYTDFFGKPTVVFETVAINKNIDFCELDLR